MTIASKRAVLPCPVQKVWAVVLAVENYSWRSDLSRVEAVDGTRFVEYTKDGYPTAFTITRVEPCRRWEFEMENSNMAGHWTGLFIPRGGSTLVCFTEQVRAKKPFLRPFVGLYLKKQQAQFLRDLQKELAR